MAFELLCAMVALIFVASFAVHALWSNFAGRIVVVALVAVVIVLLAGCGGGSVDDDCPAPPTPAPSGMKTIPTPPCGDVAR